MTTERPLRQDAARNRDRLVAAAREVFRRKGLEAPLDEIAKTAGVAIGTLYNRFPTRGALVDAALGHLARREVDIGEQAAHMADPWEAFVSFMTHSCELLASDRGYTDIHRSRIAGTPVIDVAQRRIAELKAMIVGRAQDAGVLRVDVASSDLVVLMWGIAATVDATREVAPDMWRRHLALLLDGLRAEAAHALPAAPMTVEQLRSATLR